MSCMAKTGVWLGGGLALAVLLAATAVSAAPATVAAPFANWDAAFGLGHEPQAVHFKARYRDRRGTDHTVEAWRDGVRFLHRATDDRVDLYLLARSSARGDYLYRLVDRDQRRVIDVERRNLYRIGVFTDWYGLAHVIDRVHGANRLTRAAAPLNAAAPLESCAWRAIERLGDDGARHRTRICWSARWGAPMEIWDDSDHGQPQFRIVEIDSLPRERAAALHFEAPADFQYVDANRDIDPNSD